MKAWEDVAGDPLTFTIRGKTYTIPELDYRAMLTIQHAKRGDATDLEGLDADESWRLVMGAAYDEMVADNVPAEALARAGLASLAFAESGREVAEQIWEKGVDPKAILAALDAQNAPPTTSTSTGAARKTPPRATTSGMSSRKASSAKKRPAAKSRSAT